MFEANPDHVWEILQEGSARARSRADETMHQVRDAMHLAASRNLSSRRGTMTKSEFRADSEHPKHDASTSGPWSR